VPADAKLLASAHFNLGVDLFNHGRIEEAIAQYRQALHFDPDKVEAHNNLANLLQHLGRLDEAVASYHEALRRRPDCAEAFTNLGTALSVLGRMDESIASYRQALRLQPQCAEICNNLGLALIEHGKPVEALASFDQAVRIKPSYGEPRWNRSLLWLLNGDFANGWTEYEWRWTQPNKGRRSFQQPLWDGSALGGQAILLYAEQGLGDTLQFLRYVQLVQKRGGKVIVECHPALLQLLAGFPGIHQLVGQGSQLPAFDFQAPLLSLPRIFSTSLATIPCDVPYLKADSVLVDYWRRKMCGVRNPVSDVKTASFDIGHRTSKTERCFRIGAAWQGNPTHRYDRQRSIPVQHFARLAKVPGVCVISLQKGPGMGQLPAPAESLPIVHLGDHLDTTSGPFMDTAAVMMNLDLVITSDTAVAHLAGALAVPVWIALPLVPDWRWLLKREDSPWYPGTRLFRQTRCDDWEGVFERIASELAKSVEPTQKAPGRCQPTV
jgi:Tfp pilus assembly protein PilF